MKQAPGLVKNLLGGLKGIFPGGKTAPKEPFSREIRQRPPEGRSHLREEVFGLGHDLSLIDGVFEEQRLILWTMLDESRQSPSQQSFIDQGFHREFGKAAGDRRYFFIKLYNERGWLFERSGIGWVVSRAEKIMDRNLIIRKGDAYDFVTVLFNKEGSRVRIASQRWSLDHFHPEIYASKSAAAMGILPLIQESSADRS